MNYFSVAPDLSLRFNSERLIKEALGRAARDVGIAVAYFALAVLSINFQFIELQLTPLCLPCGFGLAVILRYGYGAAFGIFVGALCAVIFKYGLRADLNLVSVHALTLWLAANPAWFLIIPTKALSVTIEPILATFLIRTLHPRKEIFDNVAGVIHFCVAALIACAVASMISTGAHLASEPLPDITSVWLLRWLSHLTGILFLTPFLTTWWSLRSSRIEDSTVLLGVASLLGLTVISELALNEWNTPYALFPILLLLAFRFGPPAATASIVIVAVSAVVATARGNGLFVRANHIETMILVQGFISIVSVTVLFLDATISERRRAFIEAKHALDRFRILFTSVPIGVIAIDSTGAILHLNAQVEKMFGYDRGELVGRSVEILLPPGTRASHARLREQFSKAPEMRPMGVSRDLFGLRKDGSEFPVEVGLAPCRDSKSQMILASVVDITERKEAERQHQNLLRRLWQAIDKERLRLAHELHDETGQNVTAVMLELRRIERELNEEGHDSFCRLRFQLEEMAKSLHRIAWELRPVSIDELGLRNALENYVSDWSETSGIEGDFHCREEKIDDVDEELRTIIYRVIQEALTNVAKHATGAENASVVIDGDHDMLRLTIEDDGRGFDWSQATNQPHNGLGLAGMRERLSVVRGELNIESTPGLGTTLFVRIPRLQELAA